MCKQSSSTPKKTACSLERSLGGHSWTASLLRGGGIMVDMVRMNNFNFNVECRTAEAQPAAYGSDLNAALVSYNLMFPGGHCPTVGLGGFFSKAGLDGTLASGD